MVPFLVCCRIQRKRNTAAAVSNALAMPSIGTDRSAATANFSQSIPKDEPEYAVIDPPAAGTATATAIATAKKMPVVTEKLSYYANMNDALPSDASEPRYNVVPCNARKLVPDCSDAKPSQDYALLDEAGIQKQGVYCTLKYQ